MVALVALHPRLVLCRLKASLIIELRRLERSRKGLVFHSCSICTIVYFVDKAGFDFERVATLFEDTRVFGVDPKPSGHRHAVAYLQSESKGLSLRIDQPDHQGLEKMITKIKKSGRRALLLWDAPLGGFAGEHGHEKERWTMRDCEKKLRDIKIGDTKLIKVPGVSVQHFTSCQHWYVSQRLTGHPQVGVAVSDQAIGLVASAKTNPPTPLQVAETHPAVALALSWKLLPLKPSEQAEGRKEDRGRYKKSRKLIPSLFGKVLLKLQKIVEKDQRELRATVGGRRSDDELDALVALTVGLDWLQTGRSTDWLKFDPILLPPG